MSNDLNQCNFIGRLGADPETRYLPSGECVCNFRIAVGWKTKEKEGAEWVPVSTFGKLAEICSQYLKKGTQVFVSGRFTVRKWQDKDGNDRYTTEIRGDRMQMLGGAKDRAQASNSDAAEYAKASGKEAPKAEPGNGSFADIEDEIPFMRIGRVASMVA